MSNDWRRQKVQDHKFDFIDVEDYIDNSPYRKFKYSLVFAIVIKGILIYCADLWTCVNLIISKSWGTGLVNGQIEYQGITISFEIYKWIFAACIILSFILLAWDIKKAVAIIQSRDISYAFTSMIAYRYYAIKSYAHFCLFEKIHNSKKTMDEIAFFCFFTFRGWKRLMFADGPRQVINGIILITLVIGNWKTKGLQFWNYEFSVMTKITIGLMTFTLTLWIISVLLMIVAVCLYIPLVIQIQGNLKEFCCHKIDKRIDEIVKKKAKSRAMEAAKNGKNDTPLQKPTLPNIGLFDEGRASPAGTPRLAAQSPHMGSPALRKAMPAPNDPYRRQYPQQPPRPYSPARNYTPSMDDDNDTKPLRQDNHAQHYHNRNMRQNQQYDFADDRSEISEGAYSAGGGYPLGQHPPKPQGPPGHRRQPSDTSTVLSGSNQGSVVGGYGARPAKPHPNQHGQMLSREAGLGNGNGYADTVMLTDMSGHRGAPNPYGGYQMQQTGLGGGVNYNPNGSVMGSVVNGPSYVDQQRGRYQQGQQNRPYN
ncbi:hypothetical protein BGZ80_009374 [Entomortierella chlamydospora]|uniref:Vacuolar membrane protein n=1 Tax=Entomortierella chlamydospora TaxID=101097 RepID=A0A9P6T152_9FUNG|nr:hypothetical protein BGZ79_000926 [Entomortierella chlamydospora]KAG0016199.1 hypothetical protein BGZ80_009374 [Entomortierella chlamydospora]